METSKMLIDQLLQSKSIIINTANPFHWSSGWKSPIYCDNRKTLSYPEIRGFIRDAFIKVIKKEFKFPDFLAGVATGAIAHAALVADKTGLPMVYVRSSAKAHGTQSAIEGDISIGKNVIIIEDLISTGKSSLKAAEALREAGCNVLGMVAIFTYGFQLAEDNFHKAGISLYTLANYQELLEQAVKINYIKTSGLKTLQEWREDPEAWGR